MRIKFRHPRSQDPYVPSSARELPRFRVGPEPDSDARRATAARRGPERFQKRRETVGTRDARRSVVTNSLFGLGAPELVVILGLGAFVLGPDKLASMAKDFGKVAGELKDVPKEFKEGLEEGEAAKAARVLESGEKEEESA